MRISAGWFDVFIFIVFSIYWLSVCPAGKVVALYSRFDVIVSEVVIFVFIGFCEI